MTFNPMKVLYIAMMFIMDGVMYSVGVNVTTYQWWIAQVCVSVAYIAGSLWDTFDRKE